MPAIVFCLAKVTKNAPARRRCRMIAGATAGTAVLPLALLLAACRPPPRNPETGRLMILSPGRFAHRLPPPWLRARTPKQRPLRASEIARARASR
jgi:hypothetical protein